MNFIYYIGEGPEVKDLIAETQERSLAVDVARKALMQEYGADSLLVSQKGKVRGLFFKEKQDCPFLKGERLLEGGYGYYPKRNYKAGKELQKKLCDPSLQFAYSSYLVKTLKIERMCFDRARVGLALYSTSAGYANDKVLVRIPSAGEDPFPEMPSWFREVKESEFLAAQGL